MLIILATQETEFGKITVQSQPRQIVARPNQPFTKKGWWSGSR
jgi:hypothetical protein